MTLHLEVDLGAGVPPFEQIRAQVLAHVAAGRLRAGDRLPTIRALASDLGVAAGTVARAYRELEAGGVVVTRRRTGTVVAAGRDPADDAVAQAARALVGAARRAGLGDAEVLDVVRGALLRPAEPDALPRPAEPGVARGSASASAGAGGAADAVRA